MFDYIDNYCERLDPSFWAEPLNAFSNLSFILSGLLVLLMLKNRHILSSKLLVTILLSIGVGSFLFHTFAQTWAAIADVVPILLFILVYIYFSTRVYLQQSRLISALSVLGFFPFAFGSSAVISAVFGPLNGSTLYVSVALLIGLYALAMIRKNRKTAIGLAIGAATLGVSIAFRSIDQALCQSIPQGTHFMWHILNGLMLGWMILVLHNATKA
ncbi:MAG: ceramidase [Rhodobacteraceae bacterium]|nr:ceramidase [Paracoccaceae bacterium]